MAEKRSAAIEPAYPVDPDSSTETGLTAWGKYKQEIARLYRLIFGQLSHFENLYNDAKELLEKILDGDLSVGKMKGALTIKLGGKAQTPFNGAANQTIDITPTSIGTFDASNKLLFPNGDMIYVEDNPIADNTQQQISAAYNSGYENGYNAGYNDGAASVSGNIGSATQVIQRIADIGTVTYTTGCLDKIKAAEDAYAALTAEQQNLVTNYDDLAAARKKYDDLASGVKAVVALIGQIDAVSYDTASLAKIEAAESAYTALTSDQKKGVTNYAVLTAARQRYEDLAAATPVMKLIAQIGTVALTTECLNKITAAENAYGALTAAQKALVNNYQLLVVARNTYNALEAGAGGGGS